MTTTNFKDCNTKAQNYIQDIRLDVQKAINIKLSPNDPDMTRYELHDNDRSCLTLIQLDKLGCDAFIFDTVKQKYIGTLDYKLISSYKEITLELYQYSSNHQGALLSEGWTIDNTKVTDLIAFIGYSEGQKTVYLLDYYDLRNYVCRNIEHYLHLATKQTTQERNIKHDDRSTTKTKSIKYSLKIDSKEFNQILAKCKGSYYSQGINIEYDCNKDSLYYRLKKNIKSDDRNKVSNL